MDTLTMLEPWLHSAPAAVAFYLLLSAQIRRLAKEMNEQVSDLRRRVARLERAQGIEDTAKHVIPVSEG